MVNLWQISLIIRKEEALSGKLCQLLFFEPVCIHRQKSTHWFLIGWGDCVVRPERKRKWALLLSSEVTGLLSSHTIQNADNTDELRSRSIALTWRRPPAACLQNRPLSSLGTWGYWSNLLPCEDSTLEICNVITPCKWCFHFHITSLLTSNWLRDNF